MLTIAMALTGGLIGAALWEIFHGNPRCWIEVIWGAGLLITLMVMAAQS